MPIAKKETKHNVVRINNQKKETHTERERKRRGSFCFLFYLFTKQI
jgi:hypothetical protein